MYAWTDSVNPCIVCVHSVCVHSLFEVQNNCAGVDLASCTCGQRSLSCAFLHSVQFFTRVVFGLQVVLGAPC